MHVEAVNHVVEELAQSIARHPNDDLTKTYVEQGEFFSIEQFLPLEVIDQLMTEVEIVRPKLNRNYLPAHKKGGSVSHYLLRESAPSILALYHSPAFIKWLSNISEAPLQVCPDEDPHACALYFYTEAGDHIGWHYDTSYYNGARYTVLLGLVDRSTSRLECRLHTKEPGREVKELSLATDPGRLIFFNGDKLHHAVTPSGEGEERIVLTLEYVTDPTMSTGKRWYSNLKDAFAYFGLPALLRQSSKS
jgi:hypothetical protein